MLTSLLVTFGILGTITAPGLIAQHLEARRKAKAH